MDLWLVDQMDNLMAVLVVDVMVVVMVGHWVVRKDDSLVARMAAYLAS